MSSSVELASTRDPQSASGSARVFTKLDGVQLRDLFRMADLWLERNAPAIDAINVFPVPDGDTGSNMAATLKGALKAADAESRSVAEVTSVIARGAVMSARGNSGVILSQWLRGFADATAAAEYVDGPVWARALTGAQQAAYGALEHPMEGTILSVARAAAVAANKADGASPLLVLEAALAGARDALARTPDQLPVLKEAGVVDSGGFGLVVLLEGAVTFVRGEALPEEAHGAGAPRQSWLDQTSELHGAGNSAFGYCTEFLLSGTGLQVAELRNQLTSFGDSLIVAGDATALHVHVHCDDPGAAISLSTRLGSLTGIKLENMQAQYIRFADRTEPHSAASETQLFDTGRQAGSLESISVVAIANGEGLASVARSLGASWVVTGGQTMNPSVEQILQAIEAVAADRVIVLPNNKNAILSAEQAAKLSNKQVAVVKTRSIPQGFAALLSFNSEEGPDQNAEVMQAAAATVRTIEITRAARAARTGALQFEAGTPIGLIDDQPAVTSSTTADALLAATERLMPADGAALALYYGQEVNADEANAVSKRLQERFPGVDVETISGGQPYYDYILSVE